MILISSGFVLFWFISGFIGSLLINAIQHKGLVVENIFEAIISSLFGPFALIGAIHEALSETKAGRNFLNKKLF